ncbi:MAG: hypothetical protein ACRD2Z_11200 [Thermoanaerobaculia bacterium]
MRRWQKILLGALGAYAACALVLGLVVGLWAWRAGLAWVAVDAPSDGVRIRVPVPLAAAEMGLAIAGRSVEREQLTAELSEVRHLLPAITGVLAGVAEAPDGVLLRVQDGGDRVWVEKRGDRLRIEIDSDDGHVIVDAPARAPQRLFTRVARLSA